MPRILIRYVASVPPARRSAQNASEKVANPSLGQMSCQVAQVTWSPHQWCDSSCAVSYSLALDWLVIVWCSMPPPQVNWAMPYFSCTNGYSP